MDRKVSVSHWTITAVLIIQSRSVPELLDYLKILFRYGLESYKGLSNPDLLCTRPKLCSYSTEEMSVPVIFHHSIPDLEIYFYSVY